MDRKQIILSFWRDIAEQNAEILEKYFFAEATINWHNTNESFNVPDFITANCEYPGSWYSEVERIEITGNTIITATHVWTKDQTDSFRVVSFFEFQNDKIISLDEYWGDVGMPPKWRIDKQIGKPIR